MSSTGIPYSLGHSKTWLRIAGIGITVAGMLVVVSWYAHWRSFLQLAPGTVSMKFNTALCFILCGAGACALTTRYRRLVIVPAALTAGIAVCTLIEYVLGVRGPLDELLRHERDGLDKILARRDSLTPRECDILYRMAQGASNKVMSHELSLSVRTVELHRARVMEKMGARSIAELVRMVLAVERAGV